MYVEASFPRTPGDVARMLSPSLSPAAGAQCFTFWYHMYGRQIGSLLISVKQVQSNDSGSLVWSKNMEEGNQWEQGEATIPKQPGQYQVEIESSRCCTYGV